MNKKGDLPGIVAGISTHYKPAADQESSDSSQSFITTTSTTTYGATASARQTFASAFDWGPSASSLGPFASTFSLAPFAFVALPSFATVALERALLLQACLHFGVELLELAVLQPLVATGLEPELPLGQPLAPLVVLRPFLYVYIVS